MYIVFKQKSNFYNKLHFFHSKSNNFKAKTKSILEICVIRDK